MQVNPMNKKHSTNTLDDRSKLNLIINENIISKIVPYKNDFIIAVMCGALVRNIFILYRLLA
jgi:hypothetical protein